ncbi:MAG: chromosome condensation regulator RCC1, partial [Myxococcales bacterium]|nr:chromosome condensation regulator RCC1 [Myxococcales bacterium]
RLALVLGDVSDDVGVTDVQLKAADGSLHAATLSGGEFRGLVPVTPGLNAIEILVSDAAGNTTTQATSAFYGQLTGAGAAHSGALVHDKVYVWGKNNEGQAGIGGVTSLGDSGHPAAPVELTFSEPLVQLQFSQNSSFALSSSGNVWAWGDNDSGQLGLGADDPNTLDEAIRTSPEQVSGVSNVTSIARGYDHTLLLLTDGTVLAFGENGKGQLGTGGTEDSDTPTAVPGLTDIVQLAAGSASSYALDASGKLYAWGRNQYGNLANATSDTDAHDTPMEITGLPPLVQLACGRDHVLALDETGKLWGWGLNSSNQVGQYDTAVWGSPLTTPVELPWNSDVVMVHAQANQSFIELRGGRILGWGQNVNGSLGVATDEDLPEPIEPVFALDRLLDVGVGALHGVAMRNDGAVFAWGWSSEGSLGGGEGTIDRWSYRVPILVIAP